MKNTGRWYGILAFAIAFGLVLGLPATYAAAQDNGVTQKEIQKLYDETRAFRELFVAAAEYVTPGVVSITTTRKVTVRSMPEMPDWPFPWGSPFEGIPEQRQRRPNQPRQREIPQYGLGSGFVIDAKNGWIITNAHVVQEVEAEDVHVVFSDGREAKAKAVYFDTRTDIAVLQVEMDNLIALEWGNDEAIRPGEWVMAIGSPMGFGNSITSGIVSAPSTKSRYFAGGRRNSLRANIDPFAIEDYIQTDAAINPGNSGGPLVTMDGRVIGINTLIVSSSMSSAGLGFAVPVRIARPVVQQLIETGKVVRGYLGVSIINPADLTDEAMAAMEAQGDIDFEEDSADEFLKKYKVSPDDQGALILSVPSGTPAAKAGIRVGDLLTGVAGRQTPDVDMLRAEIASIRPGTQVDITLRRKGDEKRVEVVVAEQPQSLAAAEAGITSESLGMVVQTLTPELAEALGYDPELKGVIITDVRRGSPAEAAGLRSNDIILQVGQTEVTTIDEFQAAASKIPARGVAFLVRRGDQQRFVTVKPDEE